MIEEGRKVSQVARNLGIDQGILDRGNQYACFAYQTLLAAHAIRCSISGKGDCWDEAPVERFFASLKRERTDPVLYPTRTAAKTDVIDYIEIFYNSPRRHSGLDYIGPLE